MLEAVSDADMAAYADGRLGGPPGRDTVSVVHPDRLLSGARVTKVEDGNSATGGRCHGRHT